MPQILNRRGALPAHHAVHGEPILPGQIYVAPPDHHLTLMDGRICLSHGPRENGRRPAIDPLFRSAALNYGPQVIGVILSGTLADGTAGLYAVKAAGGIAVVQDPEDALYSGMPRSAIEHVEVDYVQPLAELAPLLVRLASEPAKGEGVFPAAVEKWEKEKEITEIETGVLPEEAHPGTPSVYGCPDCGGTLWEVSDGDVIRFRCRVGHAWSAENLLLRQGEALEEALWTALRALEENTSLSERMKERAQARGNRPAARIFAARAEDTRLRAELIRKVLAQGKSPIEATNGSDEPESTNQHVSKRTD